MSYKHSYQSDFDSINEMKEPGYFNDIKNIKEGFLSKVPVSGDHLFLMDKYYETCLVEFVSMDIPVTLKEVVNESV